LKEKITEKLKTDYVECGAVTLHRCCYSAYPESPPQAEHVYLTCQAWREAHGRLKELKL